MARTARPQHVLEQRRDMLASAIKQRVQAIRYGVTPKGSRPPFTRQMTTTEALQWWLTHRYDPLGMAIVQSWTPIQVAQLDAWLAEAVNHPAVQGNFGVPAAAAAPQAQQNADREVQYDASRVLTQAMGRERRIEGPPIGSEVA